jgi:hypothetical protein
MTVRLAAVEDVLEPATADTSVGIERGGGANVARRAIDQCRAHRHRDAGPGGRPNGPDSSARNTSTIDIGCLTLEAGRTVAPLT